MDDDTPFEIPIEDSLDLHSFRPAEVRFVVHDYLLAAREKGFRQVRLIHGKGIGAQRQAVRSLLASLDFIESFEDADPMGGGWGATVVRLHV